MKVSVSPINFNRPTYQNNNFVQKLPTFQGRPKIVHQDTIQLTRSELRKIKRHTLIMQKLNIPNFRTVNATCVSGATFEARPIIELKSLKDLGFDTIIDFRGEAKDNFPKLCKKKGLNYYNFNLNNVINLTNPEYFVHKNNERIQVTDVFVNKLKEFFKHLNTEKVYMGCQYGIDRTNIALVLNYLLNTEAQTAPEILTWPYERKKRVANKNIKIVKKIVKRLSEEQRRMLGLPENYQEFMLERIRELLIKNNLLLR